MTTRTVLPDWQPAPRPSWLQRTAYAIACRAHDALIRAGHAVIYGNVLGSALGALAFIAIAAVLCAWVAPS